MQYHSESSTYSTSYVKTVVDGWKTAQASDASEARLITIDELVDNFVYVLNNSESVMQYVEPENSPSWLSIYDVSCWTMSQYGDSTSFIWYVGDTAAYRSVVSEIKYVRPVIVLPKSAID